MLRKRTIALIAILALLLGSLSLVGCSSDDAVAFEVGDTVAAEWDDGYLYLSEVTAVDDTEITVTYLDDDTSGTLDATQVFMVEEKEWEVDDRVLAVWSIARFYSGTVSAVEGSDYMVTWDDGSEPSLVTPDMIIAYVDAYADEPMEDDTDDSTSSDEEGTDSDVQDADLVGAWTNSGANEFAELVLEDGGTGTATDIDGTTVDATWSLADGYLEIIIVDTDGTEITTGATVTMVSDSEFTWDAENGSFVK